MNHLGGTPFGDFLLKGGKNFMIDDGTITPFLNSGDAAEFEFFINFFLSQVFTKM